MFLNGHTLIIIPQPSTPYYIHCLFASLLSILFAGMKYLQAFKAACIFCLHFLLLKGHTLRHCW